MLPGPRAISEGVSCGLANAWEVSWDRRPGDGPAGGRLGAGAAACAGRPSGELQQALESRAARYHWLFFGFTAHKPKRLRQPGSGAIFPSNPGLPTPAACRPAHRQVRAVPPRAIDSPAVQKASRNDGPEPAHPGRCPPPNLPSVGAEVSDTRDLGPPLGGLFGPGTHRPIHRRSIGPFDQ